jgi:YbgC/YbaW family acyl-CoA thioester hydrolase
MTTAKPHSTPVSGAKTARHGIRFWHRLRVRWVEVDMQKIVFNGHYLMYFDTAVADYWRALKLPYEAAMQLLGGDLYVKKATVEYHASARYDDLLDVGITCARVGTSSIVFACRIVRGDELLISGELLYVFADPATQKSKPVPAVLRDIFTAYEAGSDMVDVRLGAWPDLKAEATKIRTEVFVDEQHVPLEMEVDEADATALHALAVNRLGQALATGRLLQHVPGEPVGVARIGRMAVSRAMRGAHLGREVLCSLMDAAAQRGDHEISLHAQCSAQGFYSRLGFTAQGETFDDAGIEHIDMFKPITPKTMAPKP